MWGLTPLNSAIMRCRCKRRKGGSRQTGPGRQPGTPGQSGSGRTTGIFFRTTCTMTTVSQSKLLIKNFLHYFVFTGIYYCMLIRVLYLHTGSTGTDWSVGPPRTAWYPGSTRAGGTAGREGERRTTGMIYLLFNGIISKLCMYRNKKIFRTSIYKSVLC